MNEMSCNFWSDVIYTVPKIKMNPINYNDRLISNSIKSINKKWDIQWINSSFCVAKLLIDLEDDKDQWWPFYPHPWINWRVQNFIWHRKDNKIITSYAGGLRWQVSISLKCFKNKKQSLIFTEFFIVILHFLFCLDVKMMSWKYDAIQWYGSCNSNRTLVD